MKELALSINNTSIPVPRGIPSGGFDTNGINIIQAALTILFVLADVAALAFVIFAGIQWIISGGDKQKIQSARNRLIYSIVGLIVITLSFVIVRIVIDLIFGVGGGGGGSTGGGGSRRFPI
ncbi:MAG: hypothetical protein M1444_00020 [Patescibacteria group bacterium]|nr:hypothetical protein [Patescibacteria group bacterium]